MHTRATETAMNVKASLMSLSLALAVLVSAVALPGCYRPYGAQADRYPDDRYPQIVTLGWLRNDFFYNQPVVIPERDGRPMRVSVNVRLKEFAFEKAIPCQYRFIFLDEVGIPLDPDPAWQYRKIEPRVITNLQGFAPDIGAVDWRCEIREDRVENRLGR